MDIKKALEEKRKMRKNILDAIHKEINEFTEETGLPVSDISVEFIETTTIGREKKTYQLSNIYIKVEL